MAKKSKRILSVLLTLIMILGLLPTSVFAYEQDQVLTDGYFAVDASGASTEKSGSIPSVTEDGYTVSKTISQTGENAFDITLNVETSQTVKTNDAAVMLVIDVSNSMDYCAECGKSNLYHTHNGEWAISRMTAAINAANSFIDTLVTNNAGGGKIYVSVVKFGSYAYTVCDWTDVTAPGDWWNDSGADQVKNKISTLYTSGGTNLDAGLTLAYNRLGMSDIASTTAKYTVLLTDGEPTYYYDGKSTSTEEIESYSGGGSSASENTVSHAIAAADNVKARSTLYTICFAAEDDVVLEGQEVHVCANCGLSKDKHNKVELCENCGYAKSEHYRGVFGTRWCPVGHSTWDGRTYYYCSGTSGNQYQDKVIANGDLTVGSFLSGSIASDPSNAYNAKNTSGLNEAFKDIAASVSDGSTGAGTRVVDPMGQFINFGEVDKESVEGGTYSYDPASKTLTWMLDPDTAQKEQEGNKTTYKFKLTYSITLDTAAEGFEETKTVTVDGKEQEVTKYYPTNGYTSLKVPGKDDVVFNVPGVCGEIPEYGYKVEYYLQGEAKKGDYENYTLDDEKAYGPADLHSQVDINDIVAGYKTKYSGENYEYASGNTLITITAVEANNVIKLYYDHVTASVTVNHFYKTDKWTADGTFVKGEYTDDPQVSISATGNVGQKFTAEQALTYQGATYTFDKGDDTITVDKEASKNVINLYYTRTVDERAEASVVVNHVYRTHTWTLENGKYVLKDSQQTVDKVEESTGLKATTSYTAKTNPVKGFEDFTYDAKSENSITLKPGENVITLYFDYTVDTREPVEITVKHHYTKTVVSIGADGQPVTTVEPDDHVETVTVDAYKGENVTLSEQNIYEGDSYTSDSGNAGRLNLTNVQGGETVELFYTIYQAPETTVVTVNHIYRTITHETVEVTDAEGNVIGTKVEDHITEDASEEVKVPGLYVGQTYTADMLGRQGYTFNKTESDSLKAEVQADGATVIDLYYDKDEDKDDRTEATIDVKHIYTTHLTTIVDGEVKTIDVQDGFAYDLEYVGKTGDKFTAVPLTTFNNNTYTVVGDPTLEVVLQEGTNSTIVINYERSASNLVETTYSVNYVYDTYNMVVTDGVAGYPATPDTHKEVDGVQTVPGYVGQVVTIADGAEAGFEADSTNPATSQTLKADGNTYTFRYVQRNPLPQVNVTVNHHYTTTTIAVDGSSSSSTDDVYGTPVPKYVGEDYVAQAAANGFAYDRYTVTTGITASQDEESKNVTVTASGDVVVDFYYSKTVDNSQPVEYSIRHVYVTINWDGTRTVDRGEPITGSSYATKQLSAATDDNNGNFQLVSAYFNDQVIPGFDPDDPQDTYAVTLVNGKNEIVYTYERTVDPRETTKVMVIHNYYARDTYTTDSAMSDADYIAQEGVKPEYRTETVYDSVDDGVWVGKDYTATMYDTVYYKDEEGVASIEKKYDLVSATPEGGKIASVAALDNGQIPEGNVVTFNLIREYSTDPGDVNYTVVHEYYSNGNFAGSTQSTYTGKVGDTVSADDIAKITSFDGRNYTYRSANPETMVLAADGENVMTLRYTRTSSSGGGGGGSSTDPDPDPGTDIEEPDVPTTDLPDVPGETTDPVVEEPVEIEEPEVPMAEAPETGDSNFAYLHLLSLASALGLVALFISDKRSKKHRDEA